MKPVYHGFWGRIDHPIIGLAPMDGVTDAACRAITAKYGKPDVMFTEFTHAHGLLRAPKSLLRDFEYTEAERPVVAQIYGHDPADFYKTTHVVCELGFDGVDINMGCPARKVVSRHCGAGLISEPEMAVAIIAAVRRGILDWANGQSLEDLELSPQLISGVRALNNKRLGRDEQVERALIPYSVKTRLGYDTVVITEWIEILLGESPAVITIHGRTLKQMYRGEADWDAIAAAVAVARNSETLVLGNGDIDSLKMAAERIQASGVDGVLLGRATIGNPWIFNGKDLVKQALSAGSVPDLLEQEISWQQRFAMAVEHSQYLASIRGEHEYKGIRKHLAGYIRGVYGASELRVKVMQAGTAAELEGLLAKESLLREQLEKSTELGQGEFNQGAIRVPQTTTDLAGNIEQEETI